MKERDNILKILKEALKAIKTDDPAPLKDLSNQTIHAASITQDSDNILVAVIIYSLGKIFERKDYHAMKGWEGFQKITIESLAHSIQDIEKGDVEDFRKDFANISKALNKMSGKLKTYMKDVLEKAKVNKASRMYEHGISLEKTAKLLGVTLYDLASYTGQTGISEVPLNKTVNVEQRIKFVEELFK
ncbi:hypothetical protein HOD29_06290 [archaeon]|jgi:hypothetical protein|nr:hypothetical protein [archaeon]